jgi:putative spermidine/putrescine transport system ATP-binding protein
VEGFSKSYDGCLVVDRLSLAVEEGEFVTLLGPSGCGKSTTLMAIAGFVRPDAGQIYLRDRNITRMPPEKRGLGVMFQSYALFPHLSVAENVMFPLRMRGVGRQRAQEEAQRALDLVQLSALNAMPANLSGGQRQRVALARALVFNPEILLMDEPLGALDRRLRQQLQYEFRRLQAHIGATVLWVTHDQEEALALSDRVAVMRAGRLEQVGRPLDAYRMPQSVFVAQFLGESNLLTADVRSRQAGWATVAIPGFGERGSVRVRDNPAVNGKGMLLLRPEDVQVDLVTSDYVLDEGRCSVPARLTDAVFLGEVVRVEALDDYGRRWTVSTPGRAFWGVVADGVGSPVFVSWRPQDAHLVPMPEEDGGVEVSSAELRADGLRSSSPV